MRIKIGNYPNRLTSRCLNKHMDKKYGFMSWPAQSDWTFADKLVDKLDDILQTMYVPINYFLDKREQKIDIKIDPWDTWSMDHTLSLIVTPMLKQLKETKHGAPAVDLEDVPEELWPDDPVAAEEAYRRNGSTDDLYFERWDWCLSEMIWSFEQLSKDNWDDEFYSYEEGDNSNSPLKGLLPEGKILKVDHDGMKDHQIRIDNGLRLFAKYYRSLWD